MPSLYTISPLLMVTYPSACAAMSGRPRPPALQILQNESRSVQVTAASAPVEPLILVAEVPEVGRHGVLLV